MVPRKSKPDWNAKGRLNGRLLKSTCSYLGETPKIYNKTTKLDKVTTRREREREREREKKVASMKWESTVCGSS